MSKSVISGMEGEIMMKTSFCLKINLLLLLMIGALLLNVSAFNELEYNVEKNILRNLPSENITISAGTISFDADVGKAVICDGKYDTVTGYSGTRWAVEEEQYGATIEFDLGKVYDLNMLVLETGYPCDLEFVENCEIWNSFDVYYHNGFDYVKAENASVKNRYEYHIELSLKGIYTRKLKIVSTQSTNFRVREIILTENKAYNNPIKCFYNGKLIDFTFYMPEIVNGRVMVPLNDMQSAMGFEYIWNDGEQSAIIVVGDDEIVFPVGTENYIKNGNNVICDTKTYLKGSVPYISVRSLVEALGGYVFWDNENSFVTILSNEKFHNLALDDVGDSPFKEVRINNEPTDVFCTPMCDFAQFTSDGTAEVVITYDQPINDIKVLPRNENIIPVVNGNKATFTVTSGQQLDVEINGDLKRPLFLFINPSIKRPEDDGNVIFLDQQKYYERPITRVKDNQTIYIGDNVVVNGGFLLQGVENVRIIGNGIIYSSESLCSPVKMIGCKNVNINGPTVVGSGKWNNYWTNSDYIEANNYKILGSVVWSDGIDIVGSRNVKVKKIFIQNQDDGICIKSHVANRPDSAGDVFNILAEDCVIWSTDAGNAIEIGWELDGDIVKDLTFRNIDVIHRQTQDYKNERGALTIHNCGRANISNVLYEDVRIEQSDEQLFNIGNYVASGFNTKSEGSIKDIYFKDIVLYGGYDAPSYIRKYSTKQGNPFTVLDELTEVDNIYFENINYKGKYIKTKAEAEACGFHIDDGINVEFK